MDVTSLTRLRAPIHDYSNPVTSNFDGQLDFDPCSQNLDKDAGRVNAVQAIRDGSQMTFRAFAWWRYVLSWL